jgi:hypothetical protein
VNPGNDYLILEPTCSGTPFMVVLAAGHYAVEWFTVHGRRTILGDAVTVDGARAVQFAAQADGSIVLYLRAIAR